MCILTHARTHVHTLNTRVCLTPYTHQDLPQPAQTGVKRQRKSPAVDAHHLCSLPPSAGAAHTPTANPLELRPPPQPPQPQQQAQQQAQEQQPYSKPSPAHAMQEDPSSSSDNTTSVAMGGSTQPSPPLATAAAAAQQAQRSRHNSNSGREAWLSQGVPVDQAPNATGPASDQQQQHPLRYNRPQQMTTTGTQAGSCSLLPHSLMQLRYASRTGDITARDLRLPTSFAPSFDRGTAASVHSSSSHRAHTAAAVSTHRGSEQQQHTTPTQQPLTEKAVENMLIAAQSRKRGVDARRGVEGFSVGCVAAYAQAALLFMEACEARVVLAGKTPEKLAG